MKINDILLTIFVKIHCLLIIEHFIFKNIDEN